MRRQRLARALKVVVYTIISVLVVFIFVAAISSLTAFIARALGDYFLPVAVILGIAFVVALIVNSIVE